MVGAGKSTTAERLASRLRDRGHDTRAFNEFADDHAIRTRAVDLLRDPSSVGDDDAYDVRQWNALAERCTRGSWTIVLESVFLQNSVIPHFVDDESADVVREVFADIAARLAPAAPLLVFLRPGALLESVRRVHAERGDPWSSRNYAFVSACRWATRRGLAGEEALVELYRAWEQLVDSLLPMMDSLLLVDPQHDWEGTLQRIYER